jgi:hypothetical protein
MKRGRVLLVLVLMYVGLDLCLADMPGAFVFDPAGSVESVEVARSRLASDAIVLQSPVRESLFLTDTLQSNRQRLPLTISLASVPERASVNRLPRAATAPPSASEDPH